MLKKKKPIKKIVFLAFKDSKWKGEMKELTQMLFLALNLWICEHWNAKRTKALFGTYIFTIWSMAEVIYREDGGM